jgi:hypothetical protein
MRDSQIMHEALHTIMQAIKHPHGTEMQTLEGILEIAVAALTACAPKPESLRLPHELYEAPGAQQPTHCFIDGSCYAICCVPVAATTADAGQMNSTESSGGEVPG